MRSQISRIAQSTSLIPKGLLRTQEENDRETEDNTVEADGEEKVLKLSTHAMCSIDMWVHQVPSILKQGRLTHMEGKPIEGEEDVEAEELMKREIAKDQWEPRLK